jgi:hypothetical protein
MKVPLRHDGTEKTRFFAPLRVPDERDEALRGKLEGQFDRRCSAPRFNA